MAIAYAGQLIAQMRHPGKKRVFPQLHANLQPIRRPPCEGHHAEELRKLTAEMAGIEITDLKYRL